MNNSAAKVGEIFREAGTAFTKLSEMTLMLQPTDDATPGSKWSEEEVEMLRGCVNRFAVELNKISQHIKDRTMSYLSRLLHMDTYTVYNVSRSPPRQQQLIPQPLQQQQLIPQPIQQQQLLPQSLTHQQLVSRPLQQQQLILKPPQHQQLIPHPLQQQQLMPQPLQQQQVILQPLQQQQVILQPIQQQEFIPQQLRREQLISPLCQQPEHSFPWDQQSQINSTWSQPIITLETETQLELLFPEENLIKNDIDIADLLHFNPGIVPLTPPAKIMQDDKNTEPPSEFDDIEDNRSETRIRAVIPNLIDILDLEFYRFIHIFDSPEHRRKIGTLHAVIPENNLQPATGTISNFRIERNNNLNRDNNNLTMVTKKGYFSWSQATKTWAHANRPAANATITNNIQNIEKSYESQILQTRSDFSLQNFLNSDPVGSIQALAEKTYNLLPAGNDNIYIASQNTPQLHTDPVPGALNSIIRQNNAPLRGEQAQTGRSLAYNSVGYAGSELKQKKYKHLSTDPFNSFTSNYFLNDNSFNGAGVQTGDILEWDDPHFQFINTKKKPTIENQKDSPGPFSSLMSKICSQDNPFKSTQTQSHEPKCSDLFGNSSNTSVQTLSETTGCLSSIQTKNNQQDLLRTRGPKGRGISRRCCARGRYATRTSTDLSSRIISTLAENMDGSTHGQSQTRLHRRQACSGDDTEKPLPKRRKMSTIVTTPGPVTRSQSKKSLSKH